MTVVASLQLQAGLAKPYYSWSQKARVVTEDWVASQLYCPNCQRKKLEFVGEPLLDFQCGRCEGIYELKSRSKPFTGSIVDSAYSVKMKQIAAGSNPSFLFLQYEPEWRVASLFAVPKHIFHPGLIQPRRPLPPSHPRAGHILSSILLHRIPPEARVHIIQHRQWRPQAHVHAEWTTLTAFSQVPHKLRGWTLDVYNIINQLNTTQFTLSQVYHSEEQLANLHPENKHVRDKIRQQLQIMRDIGLLEFQGKGNYKLKRRMRQAKISEY